MKKSSLYLVKKFSPKMVSKKATEKSRFLAIHLKYHLFFHQYFHRHQWFTWNVTIFGEKIVTFFLEKKDGLLPRKKLGSWILGSCFFRLCLYPKHERLHLIASISKALSFRGYGSRIFSRVLSLCLQTCASSLSIWFLPSFVLSLSSTARKQFKHCCFF